MGRQRRSTGCCKERGEVRAGSGGVARKAGG